MGRKFQEGDYTTELGENVSWAVYSKNLNIQPKAYEDSDKQVWFFLRATPYSSKKDGNFMFLGEGHTYEEALHSLASNIKDNVRKRLDFSYKPGVFRNNSGEDLEDLL